MSVAAAPVSSDRVRELEAEVRTLRDREWRNLPDDAPSTYLGRPQPGAAPHHYGPDDVVVDGDWLVDMEQRLVVAENALVTEVRPDVRPEVRRAEESAAWAEHETEVLR